MTVKVIPCVFLAILLMLPAMSPAQENNATALLKSMSDYVGSQQSIELAFDSDIEIITPQLEKIQFTNAGEALLQRPDKLRAHRVGGFADVALLFDGQSVSIYGKHVNGYARLDAPGSGVTPGVGVGAPGVGAAPGNRGGPVNRVGVR